MIRQKNKEKRAVPVSVADLVGASSMLAGWLDMALIKRGLNP